VRNFIKAFLVFLLLFRGSYSADVTSAVSVACGVSPGDAVRIWTTSIATIYNVFPIRIGGVQIFTFSGLEDYNSIGSLPVCICMNPIPRVGITISLWEPAALAEVSKIPWCSPTIGATIPVKVGPGAFAVGESSTSGKSKSVDTHTTRTYYSYQAHWWKFPTFAILKLFTDIVCLSSSGSLDLAYVTEIDPLWQNDAWSAFINPEAILFANPVAQLACTVDSATSTVGFPLDPLWWCEGTWGNSFPLTGSLQAQDPISGSAAIVGRMIAKLHRQMMLPITSGTGVLCVSYPVPIWKKSQYGIFPIYPVVFPKRQPIGRSTFIWGFFNNIPYKNRHNFVYSVYRKRDCCAF
jgi:conjugal transfer pilus assembly protein TraU